MRSWFLAVCWKPIAWFQPRVETQRIVNRQCWQSEGRLGDARVQDVLNSYFCSESTFSFCLSAASF